MEPVLSLYICLPKSQLVSITVRGSDVRVERPDIAPSDFEPFDLGRKGVDGVLMILDSLCDS